MRKPVLGYEGLYEIDTDGRVTYVGSNKSARTRGGGYAKKVCFDRQGYARVTLSKNGVNRQRLLHILLAVAFLEKPDGAYLVDHVNGDPSDYRLQNLRWVTQRENQLNRHKVVAKSGVTGVHHIETTSENCWRALGKLNGKMVHLGVFKTMDEAVRARSEWEDSVGATTMSNVMRCANA